LTESHVDARRVYWQVLATTQRKIKGRGAPNLDLLWRRILLAAGSQYPLNYSGVALQGFCWSERSATARTLAPVISTFINWADSLRLEEEYFKTLSHDFVCSLADSVRYNDRQEPWEAFDIAISEARHSSNKY